MTPSTPAGLPVTCRCCGNQFMQHFTCTTCGAQKLYDTTVETAYKTIDTLRKRIAGLERELAEAQKDYLALQERLGTTASQPGIAAQEQPR